MAVALQEHRPRFRARRPQVVRVATEIRGAPGRLFTEGSGEIVISGPAGTGKTRAILEYIHFRASRERLRVLVIRKTMESLKTSALVTYREQVLHKFDGKKSVLDGVTYFGGNDILPAQFEYADTRSIVAMSGMDRPTKVLSSEWDIIFVNEATELTLAQWELLTGRTDRPSLTRPPTESLLLGDCNPDAPRHWIRRREAVGQVKLWESRHEDNPAMWDRGAGCWTVAGLRYIKRLEKLTGVRYQRLRLGRWAAAEGQVLDRWDRDIHIITRDQLAELGLGAPSHFDASVDWGWTKPGVISVWGVYGDGQMVLVREIYRTRRAQDWWINQALRLQEQFNIETWPCDPSQPAAIAAFRAAGLNAVAAQNAILPGISILQGRLAPDGNGRARFFVLSDALEEVDPELEEASLPISSLDEVDSWVWAKDGTGVSSKERPVDDFNHAMDTWRYEALHLESAGVGWEAVPDELSGALSRLGL